MYLVDLSWELARAPFVSHPAYWSASPSNRRLPKMTIAPCSSGTCRKFTFAISLLAFAVATAASTNIDHAQSQVDWVKANGGYFSPKIEFHHLDPDDPTSSPSGLFVNDDVAKGEVLMIIPQKCLLRSSEVDATLESTCDTVLNLVEQYKLSEKSKYWPYVRYIMDDRHRGDLPSEWSREGKELLESILPAELLPEFNATDVSFVTECGVDPNEEEVGPLQEFAHLAVLRRSWDDIMVPLLDMVNHRNGRWTNVESNSAHEGNDIRVFATRDIDAGEQLHNSYNECTDCHGYAHTYTLAQIMRDYGFVEQYPQRWNFDYSWLMFEVDEVVDEDGESTGGLEVIWFSDPPEFDGRHFLHGQLNRLEKMYDDVLAKASLLDSDHEKRVIVNFYDSLSTALDVAIISSTAISQEEEEEELYASNSNCTTDDNGEETCSLSSQPYDDLFEAPYEVPYNLDFCDFSIAHDRERYKVVEEYQSHYQRLTYGYSEEDDDTCLYLDDHLEACSSVRPHYHEVMVHYAAGFLDQVKRIIILGGGDNLLIHEVLKYESLELAVILELDQLVVRSAYQHLGAHPHWNDDRVKYYFGDAAKSLPMLPREYYGTFDIVFIDLQTWIIEMLGLMDISAKLINSDGFIMRNEDGGFGTNEGFARHSVDIYTPNIPAWCAQGVTVGSNNVDVFNRQWKSHENVSNLFFQPEEQTGQFYNWYSYRKNDNACKESESGRNSDSTQSMGDNKALSASGILMIIEAEDIGISLESSSSVASMLSGALRNVGFNEIATRQFPSDPKNSHNGSDYTLVHIMSEGYVVARVTPKHNYVALDLMLWGQFDAQEAAKSEIVNALGIGSNKKRNLVSSYRIVTGGMLGASSWDEDREKLGPPQESPDPCPHDRSSPEARDGAVTQEDVDVALDESLAFVRDIDYEALVIVVCGERSISSSCRAKNIAGKDEGLEVATIVTCPNLSDDKGTIDSSLLYDCEMDTLETLREIVEAENKGIGGIVIDQVVPHAMGQVLNKIFSDVWQRSELLQRDFAIVAISAIDSDRDLSQKWRRGFMERFRTKFVQIGPAFSADISFDNSDGSSKLVLDFFYTADNKEFFPFLDSIVQRIAAETKLAADIKYVQNGMNPYLAEFEPEEVFTDSQYREIQAALSSNDAKVPKEEFLLGGQTIFQFVVADENVRANMRLSCSRVRDAVRRTLRLVRGETASKKVETVVYDDLGEGCLVITAWDSGNAVLLWDGARSLDINLFMQGSDTMTVHDEFGANMKKYIPSLQIVLRDDQPRGVGAS